MPPNAPSRGTTTPREQLDRLLAVGRRAARYWWLVGAIVLVGGGLSVMFAMAQKPVYESETVLLYREMIPTRVIEGRDVATSTRNLSSRYKEMLMARSQLQLVAEEFELFGAEDGDQVADEMRQHVDFRSKGAGTFRIVFRHEDAELAQRVTERLANLLLEEDKRIAREEASTTRVFLEEQKDRATVELKKREKALAEFLAGHPEFAQETSSGGAGASIRAAAAKKDEPKKNVDPRVLALERQRRRIKDRLAAPDDKPVRKTSTSKTPEQIEAEARVAQAEREVESAQRDLDNKKARFTEKHPDVIKAANALAEAQKRLRRAEAAVPPDEDSPVPGAPIDREALEAELKKVERELASTRAWLAKKKKDGGDEPDKAEEGVNWVVELETDWSRLTRDVEESRDRVEALEAKVFTAEITSDSVAAQTSKLTIIDPANLPQRPIGKGKKLIVLAGLLVFGGLGVALSLGLALIDDRIYTRYDLEQVGIAPVLVQVPKGKRSDKARQPAPPSGGEDS